MKKKKNILLAKKYIKGNIYGEILLENPNITFPQTEAIIDGAVLNNVTSLDVIKVKNLKRAWDQIINLNEKLSYEQVLEIHGKVAENDAMYWGVLRSGGVSVSGTNFKPDIPNEKDVREMVTSILQIENPYESAARYISYAIKNQLFWDGNKRTALIVGSKILIDRNAGIIYLDEKNMLEFSTKLKDYYDDENNRINFEKFIMTKLIVNRLDLTFDPNDDYLPVTHNTETDYGAVTVKLTKEIKKILDIYCVTNDSQKRIAINDAIIYSQNKVKDIKIKNKNITSRIQLPKSKIKELKLLAANWDMNLSDFIVQSLQIYFDKNNK